MRTVDEIWKDLEESGDFGAAQHIDSEHPGRFYAVVRGAGIRTLLLVTDDDPGDFPDLRALSIDVSARKDGTWLTSITLKAKELAPVFGHLAQDLVETTRHIAAGAVARATSIRIGRWKRLFEAGSLDLLPRWQLRGLVAEVYVLRELLIRMAAPDAVASWQGPMEAPQDFALPHAFVEVKAMGPSALRVKITSVGQLDPPPGMPLKLATVALADAGSEAENAFSVAEFIADVRRSLGDELGPARLDFDEKLLAAGYVDLPGYEQIFLRVNAVRLYSVSESFPRLTRTMLSAGIFDASYELTIAAIAPFEISWEI